MNENPLQRLISLVTFDQELLSIQRNIEILQKELEKSQDEMQLCQVALERAKIHRRDIRKEVDIKELTMKELDDLEKTKRLQQDAASNQREYESLAKEIQQLKKKQHDLEEDLIGAWKKLEQAEQDLKTKQEFCDAKMTSLDTVMAEKMKKVEQLQTEYKQRQEQRDEKLKGIPEELLEKYHTMHKQVSNPIIPVAQNSCSACFYPVTKQDLADLKRGKLLQCKDCFRFLYYPVETLA
ncbi:MAG: hypothetical protein WDZ41_06095 [Candidatus Babeliales bacterium]